MAMKKELLEKTSFDKVMLPSIVSSICTHVGQSLAKYESVIPSTSDFKCLKMMTMLPTSKNLHELSNTLLALQEEMKNSGLKDAIETALANSMSTLKVPFENLD